MLKASSIAQPQPSPPWVELPAEITMDILRCEGTIEIVESVQSVCSTWWKVFHDPAMWRVIDLKYETHFNRMPLVLDRMCRIAVDLSRGQLLKISIQNFGSRELLNYIAERSSQLMYLQLVKCVNIAGGLAVATKNFPLLEELHTDLTFIAEVDIESVGRSCPLLKSFTLNVICMPELRHLALLANTLTNVGLLAILDGCPHLVSLDLRHCNIDLEGDLGRRCREQIVDLKHPHDDEFDSEVSRYWSSDDDYTSGFSYKCHDYDKFFGHSLFPRFRDYHEFSGDDYDYFDIDDCNEHRMLEKICRIAVDRSQGQLLEISIQNFGSKDLLNYIAESLAAAAKNFPLLEELHSHLTLITEEDIESVGRYCPLLKSFTLNASRCTTIGYSLSPNDGQALAIARSMPELRHLTLILNPLTNFGLQAILDGCPHLVSLDLRRSNIDLEGYLGRRCRQQIVDLKQPHASNQDYEFHSELKASSIAPPPPSPPWVDLPTEITVDILQRLGTIEIVESVQTVCNLNRMPLVLERICRIGVDRSQGQLLKISIQNFGGRNLLKYIAERSTQLRHLRVIMGFYDFAGGLAVYAKNFPYLEELHMHFTLITQEDIESVGHDGQALAIARSMPELRHLGFLLNTLTNVGLQAILDGCPHLVSLDLRYCNIDLEGDIGRRCRQQIVDLRQPNASTRDYEFDYEDWLYFNYWSSDNYDSVDDSEDEN
ncbi:hypothetical protein H5410_040050, partial [Solanum commersonii]